MQSNKFSFQPAEAEIKEETFCARSRFAARASARKMQKLECFCSLHVQTGMEGHMVVPGKQTRRPLEAVEAIYARELRVDVH